MYKKNQTVSVVYAKPDYQSILYVPFTKNLSVRKTIEISGIMNNFLEINFDKNHFGIFGVLVKLNHIVKLGDRVEIYRDLQIDPKFARQRRIAKIGLFNI